MGLRTRYDTSTAGLLFALSFITVSCQILKTFDDIPALGMESFGGVVSETDSFVMFYAPWCGHCKNLKPMWLELAQNYFSHRLTIATVDCTTQTSLCSEENVRGYPTLTFYYAGGSRPPVRFSGTRSLSAFDTFIAEKTNTALPTIKPEFTVEDPVHVLTEENYQQVLNEGDTFLMLYAPWCGHCKALKPAWETLAIMYNSPPDKGPKIAKSDCTQQVKICSEFDVTGYPTLLYIRDGRVLVKYDRSRELESLQLFVETQAAVKSATDKTENNGKISHMATQTTLKEPVLTVTTSNFDEVIASHSLVFLKFYAPWCGHCKRLAPVWEKLGNEYTHLPVIIGRIDCTENEDICKAEQIKGYPTLKLYKNGNVITDYSGDRSLEDLKKFVSSQRPNDEL